MSDGNAVAVQESGVLIGCVQAIEHYEIARYGLLKGWARKRGLADAERLLDETLSEEKNADMLLTQIAESGSGAEDDAAKPVAKSKAKAA